MYRESNIGKKAYIKYNNNRFLCEIIGIVKGNNGETFYKIRHEGKVWTSLYRYTDLDIVYKED